MRIRRDEDGVALIAILIGLVVLVLLAVTVLDYAVNSSTISRHDQNWSAALNAAEAGIDDYLFHLNENSNYTNYSASNLPSDGNVAFTTFVDVPGGSTKSQYTYTPDTTNLTVDGTITLTSTGKVGNSKRTLQAILRRRNFLDYLYFTDYETKDPALYTGSPFTATQAETACALHYYEGRDPACTEITFISRDTINGPMHTNDAFRVCGSPSFAGKTSTSWNPSSGNRWRDTCPTRIKLLSSGQMTVKSPFSKNTHNGCPTNGTGSLPTNGVIYVQNVPSSSADANYTAACPYNVNGQARPLGLPITNDITNYGCRNGDVFVDGTLKGQLTIAADNNIDITASLQYKDGTSGRDLLGLIANNYIEVWHPVKCTSGNASSCNLNANFPGETATGSPLNDPTIYAAMLSINHSFRVQNYDLGAPLGTLGVIGTIGQRYRGAVGTFSGSSIVSGYAKDYRYDRRLKYLAPPKFIDPVASAWAIAVWKEIPNP